MLPSPKILVVDDNADDVQAIVKGLAALGTTALGFHYSPGVIELPSLPDLRILFLDLHLLGAGDSEQQVKTTIGLLASLLVPENGPYVVVLWSSHVSEHAVRFQEEVVRRLPPLPLPLQIVPLDKLDFITDRHGRRIIEEPERLRRSIMERIEACPQLAALLSWEEDVSRAAADAVREIFQMACRRNSEQPAEGVDRLLGELAAAAVGRKNARSDVFRGVNEVLVQVVADRLLHRSASDETAQQWQKAVKDLGPKSDLNEEDAAQLNRFLHAEDGSLLARVQCGERGSVVGLADDQLVGLWGLAGDLLLKEFGLESTSYARAEWVMVQVQPPCDEAQGHACLLPYVLGLRVTSLDVKQVRRVSREKCLWLSPPLKLGNEICHLIFHLRFVAGLFSESEPLKGRVCLRIRDQLLAELTHALHSYSGRPGVVRFSQ